MSSRATQGLVNAAGRNIDLVFNGEIVDGDANSIALIGVTLPPEAVV